MKIRISLLLALTLALSGCGQAESTEDTWSDAVRIEFSDDSVTVDGNAASADSAVYTAVSYTHLTLPTICSV